MEEEKKLEEKETQTGEEKKRDFLNQFIIFLLHIIFYFLFLTYPKLFLYVY